MAKGLVNAGDGECPAPFANPSMELIFA